MPTKNHPGISLIVKRSGATSERSHTRFSKVPIIKPSMNRSGGGKCIPGELRCINFSIQLLNTRPKVAYRRQSEKCAANDGLARNESDADSANSNHPFSPRLHHHIVSPNQKEERIAARAVLAFFV
jgi:hypothetical protein